MERIAARIKHMAGYVVVLAKWLVLGALIGAVGGFVGSLFHIGVNYATSARLRYPWILYLLPLAGLVIVWLYKAAGVWGKGTNAVIESVHFGKDVPVQLVPVIFLATVLTHLCGGSAGREGAALQIGGGIGHETGKLLHLGEKDLPLATLCGMAGVFSALFGTPLTATVFALEVISVGVLYYAGLVPCITSAMVGACAERVDDGARARARHRLRGGEHPVLPGAAPNGAAGGEVPQESVAARGRGRLHRHRTDEARRHGRL